MTDKLTTREALVEVMRDVKSIAKKERNSFHNFVYRGVESVVNAVGPAMRAHGVLPLPEVISLESRDVLTKKGDTNREITLMVRYTFKGPAGDSESIVVPGEAQDAGASGVSKAMAVAQRIGYLQILAIPTVQQDPESDGFERGTDKTLDLKKRIWEIGQERGWVDGEGNYDQLAEEFTTWSQGVLLEQATEKLLQEFADFLKPPRKMQRRPQGGQA